MAATRYDKLDIIYLEKIYSRIDVIRTLAREDLTLKIFYAILSAPLDEALNVQRAAVGEFIQRRC